MVVLYPLACAVAGNSCLEQDQGVRAENRKSALQTINFRYLELQWFYFSAEELTMKLGLNLHKPGDFSYRIGCVYPAGSAA